MHPDYWTLSIAVCYFVHMLTRLELQFTAESGELLLHNSINARALWSFAAIHKFIPIHV